MEGVEGGWSVEIGLCWGSFNFPGVGGRRDDVFMHMSAFFLVFVEQFKSY